MFNSKTAEEIINLVESRPKEVRKYVTRFMFNTNHRGGEKMEENKVGKMLKLEVDNPFLKSKEGEENCIYVEENSIENVIKSKNNFICYNMPNKLYHSVSGHSKSLVEEAYKSRTTPKVRQKLKFIEAEDELYDDVKSLNRLDDSTPSMVFGSALHSYVLENDTFGEEYAVLPKVNLRTKKGKEEIEKVKEKYQNGEEFISEESMKDIRGMRACLMSDPLFLHFFNAPGTLFESSIFVHDEEINATFKCRPDILNIDPDKGFIVDLKTIDSLSNIQKNIENYGYDIQVAHYKMCIYLMYGVHLPFYFFFIEKKYSHGIFASECVMIDPVYEKTGHVRMMKGLENIESNNHNISPSDYNAVRKIEQPYWVKDE